MNKNARDYQQVNRWYGLVSPIDYPEGINVNSLGLHSASELVYFPQDASQHCDASLNKDALQNKI